MSSIADGNRAPESVNRANAIRERLHQGHTKAPPTPATPALSAPVEDALTPATQAPTLALPDTEEGVLAAVGSLLDQLYRLGEAKSKSERLEFATAGFKFSVFSPLVSVQQDCVGFFVNKRALTFEPALDTAFDMTYRGVTYNLVYLGGFFTFPNLSYALISFVRVVPDTGQNG